MSATTTFTPPAGYPSDYAVVDVETTGVGAADRIVSIAVVLLDAAGTQTGSWNSLVDPGRDPGPTHIHGLTAELLAGQPSFANVADELAELLRDRVVVAHNASFDCRMIEGEYRRLGLGSPAGARLCTVTLAKRLELPLPDWRLPSLAAHYGIPQVAHHDAVDDAWVLSEIFRLALRETAEAGLPLPVAAPGERRERVPSPRRAAAPARARQACPYINPGPMTDGRLTQGMRVAFTGAGQVPRDELVRRATDAGLAVTGSVSGKTSVLVTDDPASGSGKNRQAARHGVPIVSEAAFLGLLDAVRPGVEVGARPAPARTPRAAVPRQRTAAPRILVLHDQSEHEPAGVIRARAVERGHLVRVNLTRSIDVVVVLPGAAADPRAQRAAAMGIPCLTPQEWHARHGDGPASSPAAPATEAHLLKRGGALDLPGGARPGVWTLTASWRWDRPETDVDVVAFLLDEKERVRRDEDFVFWNQPTDPDGVLVRDVAGPCEQGITVDLDAVPPGVHRVVVAAVTDEEGGRTVTFDEVGAIEVETAPFQGAAFTRSTLDAATVERALLLGEFYRRGVGWRFRAQGQGHAFGLAELARSYGVDVE